MDVLENKVTGPAAGGTPAAPVPPQSTGGEAGKPPVTPSAGESVPLFGGNRGGRARKDGLAPGSPEAKEADRRRDAERKKQRRQQAAAVVEPPPLPSAVAGEPGGEPPPAGVVQPGESSAAPPVPWRPELLTDLVSELIDAAESGRVASYLAKCQEAGLGDKLIKDLEKDARFPKPAVIMLKNALPRLGAKWLNRTGISAEFEAEMSVITALILIVKHNASANKRLEELIETNRQLLEAQREAVTQEQLNRGLVRP